MNLIDRDKLIEELFLYEWLFGDSGERLENIINEQPIVNRFHIFEWIPVSEGLPEEHRNVIVAILCEQFDETFIDYEVACLSGDEWRSNDDGGFYKIRDIVIAWMPIPEYRE